MPSRGDPSPENERPATSDGNADLPVIGPYISNIVCGVNLNCKIDLNTVALLARNTAYQPKRFPACVVRQREPKATGLIFETGKLQVLGCKSVADAKLTCRKFAKMLQKLGFRSKLENFNVQNIVGHADTRMLIRLEGLHYSQPRFCKYEPELFPGLVYEILQPKMKVLVFAKGKLVLLGAKREKDLDTAMEKLYPVLREFRRT